MLSLEEKKRHRREYIKKWKAEPEHIERRRECQKKWQAEHPEKMREYHKKYLTTEKGKAANRRGNRKCQRPRVLLAKYGMTEDDYNILLTNQGSQCAICGKSMFENRQLLAVDHNHLTGEVRSLLCRGCNLTIGLMERPGFLEKALVYLEAAAIREAKLEPIK